MSLEKDLNTQEALDEAIKMLYHSRPAKAAALLGLVDPTHPFSLADKEELVAEKLSAMVPRGIPGAGPTAFDSPSRFPNQVQMNSYVNQEPIKAVTNKVKDDLVGRPKDVSPAPIGDNTSTSSTMPSIAKGASLRKQAMSEQEYLMYQAGVDPIMGESGKILTPTQLAALGGGTVGIAGANRLRAKNVANRELQDVRKRYLQAVQENTLTRQQLKNLNTELKIRGAGSKLFSAPTLGIADAYMAKAEKDLTSSILKNRYRGAMPLLAAGLLGTIAYNKLNEDSHG